MSNITNKMNLPDAIVEAVKNDDYNPGNGDISCTTLIGPPQIRVLKKKHYKHIVEDASSRIFSLVGQAIHTILERANKSAVVEKRLYMDAEGWKLSGQFDRLMVRDGILQDYKMCSVWEIIYGVKPDRIAQLNVLAELCEMNGYTIKKIEVVMIFRDWMKSKAKYDSKYPQAQVAVVELPLWAPEERMTYITERIKEHQAAEAGDIKECTTDERWATPDKHVVMKEGRKSALRILSGEDEAYVWAMDNGNAKLVDGGEIELRKGISIICRKGENKRCDSYCDVAPFCSQYKDLQKSAK